MSESRAAPFARTPICSSERRRRPVLACSVVTIRLCVRNVLPMNSSAPLIAEDQQSKNDRNRDRLLDHEGCQRDVAPENAGDDDGDHDPTERAHGTADTEF